MCTRDKSKDFSYTLFDPDLFREWSKLLRSLFSRRGCCTTLEYIIWIYNCVELLAHSEWISCNVTHLWYWLWRIRVVVFSCKQDTFSFSVSHVQADSLFIEFEWYGNPTLVTRCLMLFIVLVHQNANPISRSLMFNQTRAENFRNFFWF